MKKIEGFSTVVFASFAGLAGLAAEPAKPWVSTEAVQIQWVEIPGGSFIMGSELGSEDEKPVRRVSVESFRMAKTEVTRKQFKFCVDAGACKVPRCLWPPPTYPEDQPVVCVDWEHVMQFLDWIGARLPTEVEWEYAARSAGKQRLYPWGDEMATCRKAVIAGCRKEPAPVCSRKEGHTDQGLCDMAGNVEEWVMDWYQPSYEGAPSDGSARLAPKSAERVSRGGSWESEPDRVRVSAREPVEPNYWLSVLGFRPVLK